MPSNIYALGVCLLFTGTVTAHKTYTVQQGDTIQTLAKRFNVSSTTLISANNLNGKHLHKGAVLQIPTPSVKSTGTYSVQEGDNDWDLAHKFGVTVSTLRTLNPDVDWRHLQIGSTINVPGKPQTQSPVLHAKYAVITGDHAIIRRGPGTDEDKITLVDSGTKVAVLGAENGWYKLKFPKGTVGWMRGDLLKISPSVTAFPVPAHHTPAALVASIPVKPKVVAPVSSTLPTKSTVSVSGPSTQGQVVPTVASIPVPPENPVAESIPGNKSGGADVKVAPAEPKAVTVAKAAEAPTITAPTPVVAAAAPKIDAKPVAKPTVKPPLKKSAPVAKRISRHARRLLARRNVIEIPKSQFPVGDVSEANILSNAFGLRGTRYRYGGIYSRSGLDCSGFTSTVFRAAGIQLPRTSRSQSTVGYAVNRGELKPGDLVFFRTHRSSRINHVGIYAGEGKFIHAASGFGAVRVDNLNGYYSHELATARRIPRVKHGEPAGASSKSEVPNKPAPTPSQMPIAPAPAAAKVAGKDSNGKG